MSNRKNIFIFLYVSHYGEHDIIDDKIHYIMNDNITNTCEYLTKHLCTY